MKPALTTLILAFVFVTTAARASAEEWRGLTPLKSTRADVVRIFNECNDYNSQCAFTIEKEEILIEFSTPQSCARVAPDTVLSIQRELENDTTFAALQVDKRRFKIFDPARMSRLGYRGFIDEDAGLVLKTFNAQVFQINYIAGKKDRPSCVDYYRKPRRFVEVVLPHIQIIYKFDCPTTNVSAGEKVPIVAHYARTGQRLLLTWDTTGGRIIEGQTQRKIWLDTTGLEGKEVVITAELNDGMQHTTVASCTIKVSPPPKN